MFKDKVTVITGASSGIGRACAIEFARNGSHVVLAARDMQRLQETAFECEKYHVKTLIVQTDVAKEEDCKLLIEKTIEKFNRIDILINNAGISMRANFSEVQTEVLRKVFDVSFWGTVYCTKYAIPHILESKGTVIGMISIAGFRGLPGRSAYSAAKFAINGFFEVLRTEYLKDDIHFMIVAPGFTSTNIRFTALTKDGSEQGESPRNEGKMMTAETVAKRIITATKRKKHYVVMSFMGNAVFVVNKFFPRFADRMTYLVMSKEPNSPF